MPRNLVSEDGIRSEELGEGNRKGCQMGAGTSALPVAVEISCKRVQCSGKAARAWAGRKCVTWMKLSSRHRPEPLKELVDFVTEHEVFLPSRHRG